MHGRFNELAESRAKNQLRMFQSNVMAQLSDGSEVRAIWQGDRFVDFMVGDPLEGVRDFWIDDRIPEGGFCPNQYGLRV